MKWFKRIFPPIGGEKINTITIKKSDIAAIHINGCIGTSSFINDDISIDVRLIKNTEKFERPGVRYDHYIYNVYVTPNPLDRVNKASIAEISYIKEVDRLLYDKDIHIAETMRLPPLEPYTLTIFETGGTTHTFTEGSNEIRSIDNEIEIKFDKYRLRRGGLNMNKGCFIVVEGIDGAGKTLICNYIESFLLEKDIETVRTREPGGNAFSEEIRTLTERKDISAYTRQLLMYAAREESINQFIIPNLTRGTWVLSDRHELSSLAYSDISMSAPVNALHEHVINLITPDLTLYIDVDVDVAKRRVIARDGTDGFFLNSASAMRISGRYDYLIENEPSAYKLDGNQSFEDIKKEVSALLTTFTSEE